MTTPAWGDIVPLTSADWVDLPDVQVPYYVYADEGLYLHRRITLGRGLVKHSKRPSKLQKVGNWHGSFIWDAERIPTTIYAQAISFFRRTWDAHKTESEVIITQHIETKAFRLYVPTQRVSHGGVYSIYDPRTIDRAYLVVGTMHSHPGSAFHSSTDEGDARDMDGVHLTIGFLDRENPETAAMVALNGKFFHFKDPDDIVDRSNLAAATAPPWWDRYVITGQVTDDHRQAIAPYADDETWERFMGRYRRPQPAPQPIRPPFQNVPTPQYRETIDHMSWMLDRGYEYDADTHSYHWVGSQPLRESTEFNRRRPDPQWDEEGGLKMLLSGLEEDYWEDALGKDFVESLFESGLFTEEDLEGAIKDFPESGTPQYWESVFKTKLINAGIWLKEHGIDVQVKFKDTRPKLVKGQVGMDELVAP
jgi:hypothetical protein